MKLYDIVRAKDNIPNIEKGTKGTIVYEYMSSDVLYEVEFIVDGESIVETVLDRQIEPIKPE